MADDKNYAGWSDDEIVDEAARLCEKADQTVNRPELIGRVADMVTFNVDEAKHQKATKMVTRREKIDARQKEKYEQLSLPGMGAPLLYDSNLLIAGPDTQVLMRAEVAIPEFTAAVTTRKWDNLTECMGAYEQSKVLSDQHQQFMNRQLRQGKFDFSLGTFLRENATPYDGGDEPPSVKKTPPKKPVSPEKPNHAGAKDEAA